MRHIPAPALTLHDGALGLSEDDRAALHDLYVRGTPENTLRAYARDLIYITAWSTARLGGRPLCWPEDESVALRFVLDHTRDLTEAPPADAARQAAQALIAAGLRRSLAAPAPASGGITAIEQHERAGLWVCRNWSLHQVRRPNLASGLGIKGRRELIGRIHSAQGFILMHVLD